MSAFSQIHFGRVAALLVLLAPLVSCGNDTADEPDVFAYFDARTGDRLYEDTRLIPHARIEVRVRDSADVLPEEIELVSVVSDAPTVLEVRSHDEQTFVIEGKQAGSAALEIEASFVDSGESKRDTLDLGVGTPTEMELWHLCRGPGEPYGLYHEDGPVRLRYYFEPDAGKLISDNYFPVAASPGQLLELDGSKSNARWLHFDTAKMSGSATVEPTVTPGDPIDVELVPASDIDGALRADARQVEVDDETAILHRPTVQGIPICQSRVDFTVGNLTPEICDAKRTTNIEELTDSDYGPGGWVMIEPRTTGTCRYEVNYPQGGGGRGASEELGVEIIEAH
ncbi:MAG: hypothetical protein ACQEVA_02490 [Myxococcota bacterium]